MAIISLDTVVSHGEFAAASTWMIHVLRRSQNGYTHADTVLIVVVPCFLCSLAVPGVWSFLCVTHIPAFRVRHPKHEQRRPVMPGHPARLVRGRPPRRGRGFRQDHQMQQAARGGPGAHLGAPVTAPRRGPAVRCRGIASRRGRASHSP